MARAPGALIAPVELSTGDLIQALDRDGFWYNAKVLEKRGSGTQQSLKVRFIGFPASHDREYREADQGLRVRLSAAALKAEQRLRFHQGRVDGLQPDGKWLVEKIIKKRNRKGKGKEYLVRWEGWDDTWDTWEHDLPAQAIEEFEDEQLTLATTAAAPKQPFTMELAGDEAPEVRCTARDRCPQPPPYPPAAIARQVFEQRVRDAAELLEDLSNEAGTKTLRVLIFTFALALALALVVLIFVFVILLVILLLLLFLVVLAFVLLHRVFLVIIGTRTRHRRSGVRRRRRRRRACWAAAQRRCGAYQTAVPRSWPPQRRAQGPQVPTAWGTGSAAKRQNWSRL